MPGKVNPVIPEAVSQAAMLVMGYDATIATAAGLGSLELNPFLPLVADCLLESLRLLAGADDMLRRLCVEGIEADEERCAAHVRASSAAATALVAEIGYDAACDVARRAAGARRDDPRRRRRRRRPDRRAVRRTADRRGRLPSGDAPDPRPRRGRLSRRCSR